MTAAMHAAGDAPLPWQSAIAVAPNGGRLSKADHPAIPLTSAELARTAAECLDAGAAMIHLHVRDKNGAHLLDAGAFMEAIDTVRAEVAGRMVIQITTESLGFYPPAEQIAVVKRVRPEAVSLALRELAPTVDDEPAFAVFLAWLVREGVLPQIILYTPHEAARLRSLLVSGRLPVDTIPVIYVLGRYTETQTSLPSDLLPFRVEPDQAFPNWMVCAFGAKETMCATFASLLGGDIRVGFENNLRLPNGSMARDNAALVEATRSALVACGIRVTSADGLREKWQAAL